MTTQPVLTTTITPLASLKERTAMKKQTTCKIAINLLPLELLGSSDPWPIEVQKLLKLSVGSKKKKASRHESVSLLKVFLELGMPVYS